MSKLTFEIKQLSATLKQADQLLRTEPAPELTVLNEFRHSLDNLRLTAWSVSELIYAEHVKKHPDKVLAFLSAERLRRFDHLVTNLCSDIERGALDFQTHGLQNLFNSVDALRQRLIERAQKEQIGAYKKTAAS